MGCTFVFELLVKLNQCRSDEQFVDYSVNNEIAKLGKNCLGEVTEMYLEPIQTFKTELFEKRIKGLNLLTIFATIPVLNV